MKKILVLTILVQFSFVVNAQQKVSVAKNNNAFYSNPIFKGDHPDPSVLRDGDDYYMVHSSFEYYPGLLIWHSKDLINWNPVTNTLFKNVGSVWAPDLVKHKNKYYIYFPVSNTNYVITADSINGPWSDPVDLKIGNIDPGHVTDTNGKRYLYFSSGGYVPLSDDGLSVTGEFKHSYNGWPIPREWSIECFCMESPKLVKRGDYYYLTVAEGGTGGPATSHMIISARSRSPFGPWENSPYNPISRTTKSTERWWSKGHGTLFEDAKGKWWMVYHAYEKDHYNMGRQTLLEPVEWTKDGWFKSPVGISADKPIKRPAGSVFNTTFTISDSFDGSRLKPHWKFFEQYDTSRFHLADNSLTVKGRGQSVADCSPLLVVPQDHSYVADVELFVEGEATGGLVLFYNKNAYSGILANKENILTNLRGWQFETEKKAIEKHVYLRLKNVDNVVDMYYSLDGKEWRKIESSLEVSGLHHNALGGFLSLRIGLCSIGEGTIRFKNFTYKAIAGK